MKVRLNRLNKVQISFKWNLSEAKMCQFLNRKKKNMDKIKPHDNSSIQKKATEKLNEKKTWELVTGNFS